MRVNRHLNLLVPGIEGKRKFAGILDNDLALGEIDGTIKRWDSALLMEINETATARRRRKIRIALLGPGHHEVNPVSEQAFARIATRICVRKWPSVQPPNQAPSGWLSR